MIQAGLGRVFCRFVALRQMTCVLSDVAGKLQLEVEPFALQAQSSEQ